MLETYSVITSQKWDLFSNIGRKEKILLIHIGDQFRWFEDQFWLGLGILETKSIIYCYIGSDSSISETMSDILSHIIDKSKKITEKYKIIFVILNATWGISLIIGDKFSKN